MYISFNVLPPERRGSVIEGDPPDAVIFSFIHHTKVNIKIKGCLKLARVKRPTVESDKAQATENGNQTAKQRPWVNINSMSTMDCRM